MEREQRASLGEPSHGIAPASAPMPGKQTRADALGVAPSAARDPHQIADDGVTGARQALPFGDVIQRAFGRHDVSAIAAHVGGPAATASHQLGAQAYARGDAVAFRGAPDLHTAAHEAAHVVQQRAGVQLKGGVGEQGDPHERGADAVADAVVAGRSAEPLLDQMAPVPARGSAPRRAIQHQLVKTKSDAAPLSPEQIQLDPRWATLPEHQRTALLELARAPAPNTFTLDEGFTRVAQLPAPQPAQPQPVVGPRVEAPPQPQPVVEARIEAPPQPQPVVGPRVEAPPQPQPPQPQPLAPPPAPAPRLTALEPGTDAYEAPVVDLNGRLLKTETVHHALFRKLTRGELGFVYVQLAETTTAEMLARGVTYEGVRYRTDFAAGSLIKPGIDKPGRVFGIPAAGVERFKTLFGFEESAYYAQRALFPQAVGGVEGKINVRAYPIGAKPGRPDEQHANVFQLKDGTPVQVDDGWGYVNSKFAALMDGKLSREKRGPKTQGANTNYQMYQWFEGNDPAVTAELTRQGFAAWQAAVADLTAKAKRNGELEAAAKRAAVPAQELADARAAVSASRKTLYSVLTTGRPPLEMGVAMPVPDDKLVLPSGDAGKRFDPKGAGASVIRSPIDKQNWRPVDKSKVDTTSQSAKLVGDIEGIQYTLTGGQDGALTFFKGMVGVIANDQWPDAWAGLDLVVCAKDRKLYENWTHDSAVDGSRRDEADHTDRAVDQSAAASRDFTVDGTFAATQWYGKGSFVGVPAKVQKWLGGDYDGDEVAVLREVNNPALFAQIQREFQEDQVNPKLPKAFTYAPDTGRADRMVEMRSPNVGAWSGIAARVSALPPGAREWLAEQTEDGRLATDPDEAPPATVVDCMLKEIQSGIKVGTDGYKTTVKAADWEARARVYSDILKDELKFEIFHHKIVLQLLETCPRPTLTDAGWRNAYFANDTEIGPGEFLIQGVAARVMRSMLSKILPVAERANTSMYYYQWLREAGVEWPYRYSRWERICGDIDNWNGFYVGSAGNWATQVMTAQQPATASAFQLAFSASAIRAPGWGDRVRAKDEIWTWTMAQLAELFADYYAPPPPAVG